MVSLSKGQKVSLTKESSASGVALAKVVVGLGWDAAPQKKKGLFGSKVTNIDCDASAILLSSGKLKDSEDVVYFGNLEHESGTVEHLGDNLTGDGEGDDEQIVVNLASVPAKYDRIVFAVNIYDAESRKQNFGMIQNAFVRVVNEANNQELCRFNLSDNYSAYNAVIFGEMVRQDGEWTFNAIGEGTTDRNIRSLSERYR